MADIKTALKVAGAAIAGGLLYVVLNIIPLIGPLAAGFLTGYWAGGGFKRGFKTAALGAVVGSIAVAYAFIRFGISDSAGVSQLMLLFMAWVLLVWNLVGILLAAVGGGVGALGKEVYTVIPKNLIDSFKVGKDTPGLEYMVCPECGQGNVTSATSCIGCGKPLK
jgi:hypothetical protein